MKTAIKWTANDLSTARYLGTLEIQDKKGEFHPFELMATDTRLVFGGACNVGFLESGYMEREEGESELTALRELSEELETFYNDGATYAPRLVVNERM
jgi:hypothetical protein